MKSPWLIILLLISTIVSGQISYQNSFESPFDTLLKIDTLNPFNTWQIGKPSKTFFNKAHSGSKAILTDTLNPYPIKNLSSFTIKIRQKNAYDGINYISFYYKIDTDSLLDGGYIEISFDGGNTWTNIEQHPDVKSNNLKPGDTITGGIPALSGRSDWKSFGFLLCDYSSVLYPNLSTILKFTFKSDAIQTNKEGWMIDKLDMYTLADVCGGGINENHVETVKTFIRPNPGQDWTSIELSDATMTIRQIIIYNSTGQVIKAYDGINSNQFKLSAEKLAAGLYMYKIITSNDRSGFGKFTKQ